LGFNQRSGITDMTFKTLLAVTGPLMPDDDLKIVADLCEEVEGHLSALVLALSASHPVGAYAATLSDTWLKVRDGDLNQLKKRTADVSAFLAGRALSADICTEYPEFGWANETIGQRARYADIVVAGPDLLASQTFKSLVVEGVLFSSGKPLLLVPRGSRPTLKPKRVLVAWDSSVEASRALREALDMLASADDVHLTLVDPVEGANHHGAEPGADAAAYLARHGAKVTVDRLPSSSHSVAEVLRQHAADTSADLMVMGAYGHSRLREHMFGGVTKALLDRQPLPILMAR
jgi:nucleotide-binding universal stress UspA family protein